MSSDEFREGPADPPISSGPPPVAARGKKPNGEALGEPTPDVAAEPASGKGAKAGDRTPETAEMFPEGSTPAEKPAEAKPKTPRKSAKKAKEERPPLPEETQPVPDLPKPKRTAADYDLKDILADDSDDDEYTEALPVAAKITTKLPKSKFIRVRPGREHQFLVKAIKLDEEDQRPGQLGTFVLAKKMVPYFRDELNYPTIKMVVREICTIQGKSFLYMHPASTDLSNNSFNTTRRQVIADAEKEWVIARTDMQARSYAGRKRKSNLPPVNPMWSSEPLGERFMRSLGDMLINSLEHPVVKRLNGEEEGGEEEGGEEESDKKRKGEEGGASE